MHRKRLTALLALLTVGLSLFAASSSAGGRPPIPPFIQLDYYQARDTGPLGNPGCVANYILTGNSHVDPAAPLYVQVSYDGGGWIELNPIQGGYSYGRFVSYANQLSGASTTQVRMHLVQNGGSYYSNPISTTWNGLPALENC